MDDQLDDQYQDNTSTVNGKPSDLTDAQKQAKINSLVQDLNTKIKANCPTCPLVPNAASLYAPVYTPNYNGTGKSAYDNVNNKIIIPPSFFSMASDGDRESDIYHEFKHMLNKAQIARELDGHSIPKVNAGTPIIYTIGEWQHQYDLCIKANFTKNVIELKNCADGYFKGNYIYRCSNYWADEKAALKAELDGEKSGLFTLTDAYRQERMENYLTAEWELKRALDYESDPAHKLKPDGSPK